MKLWEKLVEEWSGEVDVAAFSRLSQAAEAVLKEDLADFEIEWVSSSLLRSPVHLLRLMSSHAGDSAWNKPLSDSFHIITTLVEKFPECSDQYHDDIVRMCVAPMEARVRGSALRCLAARAARSLVGLRPAAFLSELECAATCKGPLAAFIGTICEFHPETIADDILRVWRALLNMLDSNKNTESVRQAALRAAGRVLASFGDELPVAEVALLYLALTTDVGDVSLEILEKYAELFRERLAGDAPLRRRLWAAAAGDARAARAATRVTAAACRAAPHLKQSILEREVMPLVSRGSARVRCAAARVAPGDVTAHADVYALEFQLRSEIDDIPAHVAEEVCWCIEGEVPHATALLQTGILYHERMSAATLHEVVVRGLRAESAARRPHARIHHSGLGFLITESCRAGGVERYRALWAALCEGAEGGVVANRLARHAAAELRAHANTKQDEFPAALEALVRVCACAVSRGSAAARVLAAPVAACRGGAALSPAVLLLLPLLPHGDDVTLLYKKLDVSRASDEESACSSAVAALHAPPSSTPPHVLLAAVQMIIGRSDAEPATLSLALRSLSRLLDDPSELDRDKLAQAVREASRLRARDHSTGAGGGKDARVLRRDLHMFIGKYGCGDECITELDLVIAELGDALTITLDTSSAHNYQISLKRVVKLALEHEAGDSLEMLTAIICQHPSVVSGAPAAVLLSVLSRVLTARAGRAARGEAPPPHAPPLPALARHVLQRVCECASVGTRRVLCDVVRPLLSDDTLLHATEYVMDMLAADSLVSVLGALDAAVVVVSALREDTVRACALLPRLPPLLAATEERAAAEPYRLALSACLHIRHVFSPSQLEEMMEQITRTLWSASVDSRGQAAVYKTNVQITVDFLKELRESGIVSETMHRCERDGDSWQCYYLMASLKRDLVLESGSVARSCLERGLTLGRRNCFDTEAGLVFVAEFADVLLEEYYEDTILMVSDIVSRMSPEDAVEVQGAACACARAVPLAPPPRALALAIQTFFDALPLDDISEQLQRGECGERAARALRAARCVLQAWRVPHAAQLVTRALRAARPWPELVVRLYAQEPDRLQEHMGYVQDVVWVAVRLGPADTLPRLLLQDRVLTELEATRDLMPAIYTFLLRKPFVLCKPELAGCCTLLRDVAACCTQRDAADLLALADELWDTYASQADPAACAALLTLLVRMGASETSRCVSETARRVSEPTLPLSERAMLLPALPPCHSTTVAYTAIAGELPARVSECTGAHAVVLRGVLDAAASHSSHSLTLLELLARLAAGEETRGWWDSAMASCMASLATTATGDTVRELHARVLHNPLSTAAADRLLVPLISECSATVCEQYFGEALPGVLRSLRAALAPADTLHYRRTVVSNTLNLTLITLMVEKVARGSLESPASALHARVCEAAVGGALRPWHYVREACKLVVTLQRKTTTPPEASSELRSAIIVFQQRAYCALCALVCVWRAHHSLYDSVVGAAWDALVETDTYDLPLRALHLQSHRTLVAAGGAGAVVGVGGGGGTSRAPRVFLRTLSENPYSFDLFDEEEETERVEMIVSDSALNRHPCAPAISALLRHLAATVPTTKGTSTVGGITASVSAGGTDVGDSEEAAAPAWLEALCNALCNAKQNVRWLLAQCIVNVRAEVRTFSARLAASLLTVVRDTHLANSLHVAIVETVSWWWSSGASPAPPPPPVELLSACASVLVRTCLDVRERKSVHYALLATLSAFFKEFPSVTVDWGEVGPHLDGQERGAAAACVRVLTRASRAGVLVPELVPALLRRLANNERAQMTELSKLFGAAVLCVRSASERARAWEQYSASAARVRTGDVTLYVNMLHHARCTDMQHFQFVADTAAKVRSIRDKCVSVLAASVRANVHASRARQLREQLPADLRAELAHKCADLLFDEMLESDSSSSPVWKRARTEHVQSRVLATRHNERAFALALDGLRSLQRWEKLEEALSEDLPTRFVECVYVCLYLPSKYPPTAPVGRVREGDTLSSLLRLLLKHLRSQPAHLRNTIPRPAGRVASGAAAVSCGSRAGTLRTARVSTARTARSRGGTLPASVGTRADEEAPIPLERAVETFLRFGESCWEVSESVVAGVWSAHPCDAALADMLSSMLVDTLAAAGGAGAGAEAGDAPAVLRLVTDLMPFLPDITPFEAAVGAVSQRWARSEAARELQMIKDEVILRAPPHPALRPMGLVREDVGDVTTTPQHKHFSIEALVESFGSLGEWSRKTVLERRRAEAHLPPLWAPGRRWRDLIATYTPESSGWFEVCVRVRRGGCDVTRALRAASAWPLNHFRLSAVTESIEVAGGGDVTSVPALDDDTCLAEWAARLQLRASETDGGGRGAASRSHALAWSRAAVARSLPRLALDCIRICTDDADILDSEVMGWITVRAAAMRAAAAELADTDMLNKALRLTESGARFVSVSSARDVVLLCQLHLDLHMDLGTLTDDIVERTVSAARGASERDTESGAGGGECERDTESGAGGGECERDGMRALCDTAILHYDDTSHTRDEDTSIELMCGVLQVCASETGVAVVLNRLLEGQGRNMGERAADCLIKTLVPLMNTLPQHMTSTLVRCLPALPAGALRTHAHHIHKLTDRSLDKWRACLQLLCGAERTLLAHCEALQQALHNKDGAEWGRAFVRMREEVFDTTLAGPDYRALHTHKQTLYDVEHTGRDMSPSNVSSCASAVRAVEAAVRGAPPRARRSVAALCPALAERRDAAAALACLLRLPEEHVLGLEDEIPVFTDSVCEPGVVSVRMRGAARRRYLIKRERVSLAASAGAFARALSRHSHSEPQVIVLSEDCGLVEFLEGHERVRDLIQEEVDLAGIPVERHARRNEELILASEHLALDNFTRILHHVPPLALRRAFSRRCADTAHFLSAQRQYVAALARVTLHTWLAGLGDRHLNNVLVCARAGALCAVDSGALLQREPVPARLTAQLRAVAPHGCLEASLQQGVRDARDRRRRLMPLLKLALHIALPEPALEVREVEALLRGTLLSHEATCRALERRGDAPRHADMLRALFAHAPAADPHSLHTQVSCLLLQCTSPRVLSVTRTEWEPWL